MENFVKVAQTLSEDWVITIPNKYEAGWETEVAAFNQNNPIVRRAIAFAAVSYADSLGYPIVVESHLPDQKHSMSEFILRAASNLSKDL